MIVVSQLNAHRYQRFFKCRTKLAFQVFGPQTIFLARENGEAQTGVTGGQNDGIQLTQANTATPFTTWWKGELWHRSSVANGTFVMLIVVDEEQTS